MTKPLLMRRRELFDLLESAGISVRQAKKLLTNQVIKQIKLPGMDQGRSYYSRHQVERDVLEYALSGHN